MRDRIHKDDEGWWFWDETDADRHGPYQDRPTAEMALERYRKALEGFRWSDERGMYIHLREKK